MLTPPVGGQPQIGGAHSASHEEHSTGKHALLCRDMWLIDESIAFLISTG
jgi:hypothetical protein